MPTTCLDVERTIKNPGGVGHPPTALLPVACGVCAATLYYLQPLAGLVGACLGIPAGSTGLVATMGQVGYGLGLLLIVPLADLVENRRLMVIMTAVLTAALLAVAGAPDPVVLLAALLAVGIGAVTVQLIVVYAAYLAPEHERGRLVGRVTSGLMLGIMMSRPAAGAVAQFVSWRWVPLLGAIAVLALGLRLRAVLPLRRPSSSESYRAMLASLSRLYARTPVLWLRIAVHTGLFLGFGAFWTVVPLYLHDGFGFSPGDVAAFSLTGIASVLVAPVAGRAADRNAGWMAIPLSITVVVVAFVVAIWAPSQGPAGVTSLCIAALLVGAGVTGHVVFAQRDILDLAAPVRARCNGLFMAAFFTAGAIGSAVGGWIYVVWGWRATCTAGLAAAAAAMLRIVSGRRGVDTRS